MTDNDLDILAAKIAERIMIPRWMNIREAAAYSKIGQKRLKALADAGEIAGHQEDTKQKAWIFDKESIDRYRSRGMQETNVRFNKILDQIGR
jgi:hypothetical protein